MRLIILLLFPVVIFAQTPNYDSLIKDIAPRLNTAGASVLIVEKGKTLVDKGYGYAHIGFKVAATPETKYFMVVPGTLMLAASVLQQVDKGKISLDDDISKFLPEFTTAGKKITIRHLLSSTSGIPDLHYLGDPYIGLRSMHRNPDEVIDMFSGLPLTMEPGSKFDWSISNYAVLAMVLEKLTKQAYKDYASDNFIKPLGLSNTEYMEPHKLIANVAEPYSIMNGQFYKVHESIMKYDPSLRYVTTTSDVYKIWTGLVNAKSVSSKSYALMTGAEEMKRNRSGNFGYGIQLVKDSLSEYLVRASALEGYSNFLYYNPDKDLTIIVLSNSGNQSAREIGRRLGALASGMPVAPVPKRTARELENVAITEEEMNRLTGTYVLKGQVTGNGPLTYNFYTRTGRVFIENGKLMIQFFGDLPVLFKKQQNGTFIPEGQGTPYTFHFEGDKIRLSQNASGNAEVAISGLKTGNGDARTFRNTALKNVMRE